MKKIIVASNNEHKITEIKEMLKDFNLEVLSLKDALINIDIEETGDTFMENAFIKAKAIFNMKMDCMVLSDDSGLMVDALGGAPGVYSARFAGEHGNTEENNKKLLKMLDGKKQEERKAKFVCAMVLIIDENKVLKVQGETEGIIINEYRGNSGFGYDPLFFVPRFNKTFSEMTMEEKNSISHRGNALKKLKEEMKNIF